MKTVELKNQNIKGGSSGNGLYCALENIKRGRTTVINGEVVTRWNQNKYEIGTWGRTENLLDVHRAVEKLSETEPLPLKLSGRMLAASPATSANWSV